MADPITFGTDGWRAIIADSFTFDNVERVAYAIGLYVKETYKDQAKIPPMLVGYDTRFLADKFAKRAAEVLLSMGIPAKLSVRDIPTPGIAYAVTLEPTCGAIQVTASHNPPEYCGIKYIPDYAGPATNVITNKIVAHLDSFPEGFVVNTHDVPSFDARADYIKNIGKLVNLEKIGKSGLKVAYDALYSTSRGYLDDILKSTGVTLEVLHNWRDPLFGGGMPEPKGEYLTDLKNTVVDKKFDVGLATDGDADRFGVIDEKGNYFTPNQLLCLLTRHLVKNRGIKGAVVRTVATTHLLDHLAKKFSLDVRETPVGFKYVGELMRDGDVLIGGEESGGVSIKGHIPEKDGILANLLLVECLAYEGKPLSVLWNELQDELGVHFFGRRGDLHLNKRTQKGLMDKLTNDPFATIGDEKVRNIGRSDGLKFYFDDDNWLLVRSSGTEPLIRLYFEGTNEARVDKIVKAFNKQVEEVLEGLEKATTLAR